MISSISSSASYAAAAQAAAQTRTQRLEALNEKLFSKLDADGSGGISKTELGDFLSFAASGPKPATATPAVQAPTSITEPPNVTVPNSATAPPSVAAPTNQSPPSQAAANAAEPARPNASAAPPPSLATPPSSNPVARPVSNTDTPDPLNFDLSSLFGALDTDADGSVSATELSGGLRSLFQALREQLAAGQGPQLSKPKLLSQDEIFNSIDANSDGTLDEAEFGELLNANSVRPRQQEGGGFLTRLETLVDAYRSTAQPTAETSSVSAAA